jgi:hypothetical protein
MHLSRESEAICRAKLGAGVGNVAACNLELITGILIQFIVLMRGTRPLHEFAGKFQVLMLSSKLAIGFRDSSQFF